MQNFKLNDEFRNQLLESAAWSKIDLVLSEAKAVEEEEQLDEAKKKKKDEPDNSLDVEDHTEPDGDGEQLEEEVIHICPLCISQLDEAIDEERLIEHTDVILGLIDRLSSLNEDEEDVNQVIDDALESILLGDMEEE